LATKYEVSKEIYSRVEKKLVAEMEECKKAHSLMEIPDYLTCRISEELLCDPVVIESGFTFEREQIERHFQRNGASCPVTRQQVNPKLLIANQHIKQAATDFLINHPWAFEYDPR
jgi:hypothetical protein